MVEKKFYLTKEGLEKAKKDYEKLRQIKMAKTADESPQFLHSDDLDADYISFHNDLDLLDAKILDLETILHNFELIEGVPKDERNTVEIGAKVKIQVDGEEDEFTIVGAAEANPSLGKISYESPVGRALLGHKAGDEVAISSPTQTFYKIKNIKYSGA